MKYEKAQNILPEEVIKILQNYIDGTYLYIPRKSENKKSWGENSGVLKNLEARNKEIFNRYSDGVSIKEYVYKRQIFDVNKNNIQTGINGVFFITAAISLIGTLIAVFKVKIENNK